VDYDHWEILIDTGTKQYWEGDSYCMDLLDRYVSKPIEVFVLSHPDGDHYNGFELISERYGVVSIWHGPDPADDNSGAEFLNAVVPSFCERELSWTDGSSPITTGPVVWEVLHPLPGAVGDDDSNSLVLKMTYGSTVFLFTGDIHVSAQRAIMRRFPDGVADSEDTVILKLPHHGSDSHVDADFYEWSHADYAICSSDRDCCLARVKLDEDVEFFSTAGSVAIHVYQATPDIEPEVDEFE